MKKSAAALSAIVAIALGITLAACDEDSGDSAKSTTKAETTKSQAAKPATAKPSKPSKPSENITASQKNALAKAKMYLGTMAFSKKGLADQLSSEIDGFSKEDAVWAASKVDANWGEQAEKKAKEYQDTMPMSGAELKHQLEFDGFTPEEAAQGVAKVGL